MSIQIVEALQVRLLRIFENWEMGEGVFSRYLGVLAVVAVVRHGGVDDAHAARVLPHAAAARAALHHQPLLHVQPADTHYHLLWGNNSRHKHSTRYHTVKYKGLIILASCERAQSGTNT